MRWWKDRSYVVKEQFMVQVFEDCSMQTSDDINALDGDERFEMFTTISKMLIDAFFKISNHCADSADRESSSSPSELYVYFPIKFWHASATLFSIIQQQHQPLNATHTSADFVKLEDKFRSFKNHISSSESAKLHAERFCTCCARGGDIIFKAWDPFQKRFSVLVAFCGGLAAAFPNTVRVEFDFSQII